MSPLGSGALLRFFGAATACLVAIVAVPLSAPGGTGRLIATVLVTALSVAALEEMPIMLPPAGTLPMTASVTLTTLALFGWATVSMGIVGAAAIRLLARPVGHVASRAVLELLLVTAAAGASAVVLVPSVGRTASIVIVGTLVYGLGRTVLAAEQLHRRDSLGRVRALSFLGHATGLHLLVFGGVAGVVALGTLVFPLRLWAPGIAAVFTLQLYLPRIVRGREDEHAVAATAVLANAVDAKDPYTADHSADVAALCRRLARHLGQTEARAHRIYLAGLLHDVGKIAVPDNILLKPAPLTSEERLVMVRHVEDSVQVVQSIPGLSDVVPMVAASHEHLDGSGYPRGLRGDEIVLGARINLVVDAYSALTTNRPYRAARSPEAALAEIETHAGTEFDPQVVAALRLAVAPPAASDARRPRPRWVALLRGLRAAYPRPRR